VLVSIAVNRALAGDSGRVGFSTQVRYPQATAGLFRCDTSITDGRVPRQDGVRMPEAIPVFDDPYAITITDTESDPDKSDSSR
jgi:hypothetical protein